MNTEMKWGVLLVMFLFGIPLAGMALKEYQIGQCRTEAIRASMPADQIEKVCK